MQELHPFTNIQQLLLSKFAASFSLLQSRPELFHFGLKQVVASLNNGIVLLKLFIGSKRVIKLELGVL